MKKGPAILVLVLFAGGCGVAGQGTTEPEGLAELKARVDKLETASAFQNELIAALGTDGTAHANSLTGLQTRLATVEANLSLRPREAFLTPSGVGYVAIDTNVFPVLVSFNGIEPLGNGSRILVNVGNLSAASAQGATLKIRAVSEAKEGAPAKTREVNHRFTGDLLGGRWVVVGVPIEGIPPSDFAAMGVSVSFDLVSLN